MTEQEKEIQEHHLASCVETVVVHKIECANCCNEIEDEYDEESEQEFLRELIAKGEMFYADSEMYGMLAPICKQCFEDDEYDFELYLKKPE